jgi:hypothetical protein
MKDEFPHLKGLVPEEILNQISKSQGLKLK